MLNPLTGEAENSRHCEVLLQKKSLKIDRRFLQEVNIPKHAPKIALSNEPLYALIRCALLRFFKENFDSSIAMVEQFNADQVLVFVNDDFDISEGEDSDFEGDGVYSYRSDAFGAISNIEELNSSPLLAIASGNEEPLSSDSEWLPSLQQDTSTGKTICQVSIER